ncbi:hypothetical protein ABPG74_006996 [Tetrahymena malaccensis]
MKIKIQTLILFIILDRLQSDPTNYTDICLMNENQIQFYRVYIFGYTCQYLNGYSQDYVDINQERFYQKLPFFWNYNGILSTSSFCLYQILSNNLQIKIYDTQYLFTQELEIIAVKEILQVSQSNNYYYFYLLDNQENVLLYKISHKFILKTLLNEKPKLMKVNLFTQQMNKCLYKIEDMTLFLQKIIIFCIDSNENDEFEDIQSNGSNNFVISTQKNTYIVEDNLITQILPNTNVYLFLSSYETNYQKLEQIQDISEKVQNIVNLPKFNYNIQINQFNKVMAYRDPSFENEQRVEYIYEIKFQYENYVQKINQQDNNKTNLYFFSNMGPIQIYQINDQDGIYEYYLYDYQPNFQILPDSSFITQFFYFQLAVTFILSFCLSLLIFRRQKMLKEIRIQTEDLIFRQVIQISKQQFQQKYELDFRDSLGSGSFGQVYKVKNKYKDIIKNPDILQNMPDYYACKQIHMQQDGENQSLQIIHEIEVLEKLKKYESVIKLQNYIIEERSTYIILDLAESTLQDLINSKQANSEKFDESEIVKFLFQIGRTLALIYTEEGIAHRDIKPSNILIKDGDYFLSDFGCAEKLFESEAARNNLIMGTLKWMSPELREMKKSQTIDYFKSDIFSLGMLLLYMLTLSDISSVNSDEFTKSQKIRIMKNYCKDISNEIILLISKMLETNPDNRPDAAIIINAIDNIQNTFKQKMKIKIQTLILFIILEYLQSNPTNHSSECLSADYQISFQRGYFFGIVCYQVAEYSQNIVVINNRQFYQIMPYFWNSNGISSRSSFCLYQILSNNLQIKIFSEIKSFSQELEINGVKDILQVSQLNDSYYFYLLDKQDYVFLYKISDELILKILLNDKPKLMKNNLFTQQMNKCLYKIEEMQSLLQSIIIFCIEDNENDEFEDIQSYGSNSFVVSTQKNTYVVEDNLITQILPNTNVYLFLQIQNSQNRVLEQIQDISEKVQTIVNFPKFNYNIQIDQFNKVMSFRDPLSENEQRVDYIYEIKLQYEEYVQKINQQDNDLSSLYIYPNYNFIFITKINDQDGIYDYQIYDLTPQYKNLPDSRYINKLIYLQSAVTFIVSCCFSLLILRRSKKRSEIRASIEDQMFKQVIQISKKQFQKKYELDYRDSLGFGSFGQVYKVKNKYKDIIKNPDILQNMPDYYACKQIHMQQDGENQSIQIFHEIEVLEKLKKYENVIKLQNYTIEERSTYIILDLADSTLQDQINSKQANLEKFKENEIVKFLTQIGRTLAIIYIEEGIAHRDIKPSNILIKDENYYLSDFGCAELLFESEEARNNLVMGTLKWMSPELREKKKDRVVDYFKSDIFSLGMLLLYMLTLQDISSVNSDEFTKKQRIRIMKNYCKDISNEIILLITKMLETNPDNRPDAAIIVNTIQDIENSFKKNNKTAK